MNIKKPNSFARYGNDYVAPLTTIDQIVKPSGERYTDKEFELMSNVENVMFGENSAGRNLLNPTLQTTTKNGVTCTNNGDGTYTFNGTATDNTWFTIAAKVKIKRNETVKLIASKNDNSFSRVYVQFLDENNTNISGDITENTVYAIPDKDVYAYITIAIYKDKTVTNEIAKPMLTDDLSATYDDFEPYVKSLRQLTDSALNMDLLWTNASPTSEFRPQTISLDLSNYKMVIISHINYANTNEYEQSVVVKGTNISLMNSSFVNLGRNVECNDNGLVFGEGYYYNSYNVRAKSPDHSGCIPYQIYGVR